MIAAVRSELRGAVTLAAIATLLALILASVNFDLPVQDVFQSLRFHLAAAALLIPLLLLTAGARGRAIGMLLAVCASAVHGGWTIHDQQSLRNFAPGQARSIQVLSFNVLANSEQGQNVADYMIAMQPDLIVIMETAGIERALERLESTFPYRVGCEKSETCDLSLFSRTPIDSATVHLLGPLQRERLITAKTTIEGETLSIAALHLSKPYFDGAAAAELWQVSHELELIDGPLLVAGDFNAPPWSTNVARFMRRNGLVPAPSYPATWPVRLGDFGLPIDNIFTRGGLQVETIAATSENFGSNHRGLIARIGNVPSDEAEATNGGR